MVEEPDDWSKMKKTNQKLSENVLSPGSSSGGSVYSNDQFSESGKPN